MPSPALPELGFYALAGAPASSREIIEEIPQGEQLGFGHGLHLRALQQQGSRRPVRRGRGGQRAHPRSRPRATNHNTRHPMVTAGYALTMQSLTGGRFIARARPRHRPVLQDAYGIPRITTAQLEDFAGLMRRLFRGEAVIGHDGPAGSYPVLQLDPAWTSICRLARRLRPQHAGTGRPLLRRGRAAHLLHRRDHGPLRADGQGRGREGRPRPGRRPGLVLLRHHRRPPARGQRLKKTVGRLATYLQGYGDLLVRTNGWDPAVLSASWPTRSSQGRRVLDAVGTTEQLEHVGHADPGRVAAAGRDRHARAVRRDVRGQFALGCDGVIMHGCSPAELTPVVAEYRAQVSR